MTEGCTRCGRSFYIQGHAETVFITPDGFQHGICDDRWDPVSGEDDGEDDGGAHRDEQPTH